MTIAMKLSGAASAMAAQLIGGDADFYGVSTDSRKIGARELFVALRGENFDGHQFVATAKAQGAAAGRGGRVRSPRARRAPRPG